MSHQTGHVALSSLPVVDCCCQLLRDLLLQQQLCWSLCAVLSEPLPLQLPQPSPNTSHACCPALTLTWSQFKPGQNVEQKDNCSRVLHDIHSFNAQQHVKQMAAYDKGNSVVNAASMSMMLSNPGEDLVQAT